MNTLNEMRNIWLRSQSCKELPKKTMDAHLAWVNKSSFYNRKIHVTLHVKSRLGKTSCTKCKLYLK